MTPTREPSVAGETSLHLELYRAMVLIRGFEDLIQSLFLRGEIYGTTHLYTGQEAVAVGVASVLEDRDRVAATYRGHGHALALGVDPQGLLDEMLGRASARSGSWEGPSPPPPASPSLSSASGAWPSASSATEQSTRATSTNVSTSAP
jgi:TPP-dependent pyruvate/acetoin dehydrogenase alpha subunit